MDLYRFYMSLCWVLVDPYWRGPHPHIPEERNSYPTETPDAAQFHSEMLSVAWHSHNCDA